MRCCQFGSISQNSRVPGFIPNGSNPSPLSIVSQGEDLMRGYLQYTIPSDSSLYTSLGFPGLCESSLLAMEDGCASIKKRV